MMKVALQEFGGTLEKLRLRFDDLDNVVKDLVDNRGTVPATSVLTVTSETFRADAAKRALFKIVTEWLTTIPPESVVPADAGPGERSKLPFTHTFPRLIDIQEVKEPMRRALFRALGMSASENSPQYVDAFNHAYDHHVPVKRNKLKGEDEITDAGIHQRFRKIRRGIKANRLAKHVKTFVDAGGLVDLEYPGEWRKPDRDRRDGCFFFQDEGAATLFDGIFSNPQLEGFDRVLSLCQIGVLDQMFAAKLSGSASQKNEGHDQGISEKTSVLAEEVADSVLENGWQLNNLSDHAGCVCDCCFIVELGGYPSGPVEKHTPGDVNNREHHGQHDEGQNEDTRAVDDDGDAGEIGDENGNDDGRTAHSEDEDSDDNDD